MDWLVPVATGLVFWNGLYLLMRSVLVRAIFDPFLKGHRPRPQSSSPKTRLANAEVVELSERSVSS